MCALMNGLLKDLEETTMAKIYNLLLIFNNQHKFLDSSLPGS